MQLLRYLPCEHVGHKDCQFYLRHHDTIPELATMQPSPRVYTARATPSRCAHRPPARRT